MRARMLSEILPIFRHLFDPPVKAAVAVAAMVGAVSPHRLRLLEHCELAGSCWHQGDYCLSDPLRRASRRDWS